MIFFVIITLLYNHIVVFKSIKFILPMQGIRYTVFEICACNLHMNQSIYHQHKVLGCVPSLINDLKDYGERASFAFYC